MFDNQMAEKKRIEDGAMALQRKMNQVTGWVYVCVQPLRTLQFPVKSNRYSTRITSRPTSRSFLYIYFLVCTWSIVLFITINQKKYP